MEIDEQIKKTSKIDWKNFREWLQLFIIIVATLIGAYEFVYKDIYKPSIRPTSLNIQSDIQMVGEKNGMKLIQCKIVTDNPTDRRVYVPAFWFTVRGFTLGKEFPDLIKMNKELKRKLLSVYPGIREDELSKIQSPYRESYQSSMNMNPVIHDTSNCRIQQKLSGKIVFQKILVQDNYSWWEPMDKTTNEYIFAIPAGMYDYLEMSVNYFHTRFINDLDIPDWSINPDGSYLVSFSLLENGADSTAFTEWQKRTASGYNWSVTTLPLWQ